MIKPRILVTGGAGRTGTATALGLLARGFPVRAFVRRLDARARLLEDSGAELFVGNLYDFRDLQKAMAGVRRAYYCPPFAANLLHGAAAFALAAEDARLETVVLLSGWNPNPGHPAVVTREHWLANNLYRLLPSVGVVHLAPGLFANSYLLGLPMAVHFGMLVGPFGDGLNAPPSTEDIARVAVSILGDPAAHIGRSYRPTGPRLVSAEDVAHALSVALGRRVRFRNASSQMFVKAALAQGFPLFEISQVRHYMAELQRGTFAAGAPTDHVELVTGSPAEPLQTTVDRYVRQPRLIHPGLRVGSKLDALATLMRMVVARAPDLDEWERNRGHPQISAPTLAHEDREWTEAALDRRLLLLNSVVGSANQAAGWHEHDEMPCAVQSLQ
jgi:NAD(P)H dehydrogenase (quinone)